MFGSMHRVRRDRRNRINLEVSYPPQPIDYSEAYFNMYVKEVKRRRKLEHRINDARKYVINSDIIPLPAKKILKTYLKTH